MRRDSHDRCIRSTPANDLPTATNRPNEAKSLYLPQTGEFNMWLRSLKVAAVEVRTAISRKKRTWRAREPRQRAGP